MTGLSTTSTRILTANEANIVRAPAVSRPLLALLDTYSPELPCLLKGAARYAGRLNEIFKEAKVWQTMSLAATQRRPYDQRDIPSYGERSGPEVLRAALPEGPAGAAGQLQERHRARLHHRG